jgi:hypothetical protein
VERDISRDELGEKKRKFENGMAVTEEENDFFGQEFKLFEDQKPVVSQVRYLALGLWNKQKELNENQFNEKLIDEAAVPQGSKPGWWKYLGEEKGGIKKEHMSVFETCGNDAVKYLKEAVILLIDGDKHGMGAAGNQWVDDSGDTPGMIVPIGAKHCVFVSFPPQGFPLAAEERKAKSIEIIEGVFAYVPGGVVIVDMYMLYCHASPVGSVSPGNRSGPDKILGRHFWELCEIRDPAFALLNEHCLCFAFGSCGALSARTGTQLFCPHPQNAFVGRCSDTVFQCTDALEEIVLTAGEYDGEPINWQFARLIVASVRRRATQPSALPPQPSQTGPRHRTAKEWGVIVNLMREQNRFARIGIGGARGVGQLPFSADAAPDEMALALANAPDSFFEETALLLPGTAFQILADHFALGPDQGHFKFHHPQVSVSAVTWRRNPTHTMPYRAHCLLLIRLALAKHTNESATAVVTRQLLRAYAAAAVSGQMKTLFPIATVRYNAGYAASGAASVSLQADTPSVYAALQASTVTDIIAALQACVPPVTEAFFLSWKIRDFGSLAALFGLLPPLSMGTAWLFSNAAGSKGAASRAQCAATIMAIVESLPTGIEPSIKDILSARKTALTEQPANRHWRTSCAP